MRGGIDKLYLIHDRKTMRTLFGEETNYKDIRNESCQKNKKITKTSI